ncbi:p450 domain-containing protein [Cephalotus follicularis]|uniref:p450 domain-containing protein n=1 Tax=Cephalotus follicularis TaxID=3775 RepID=A0A1Q3BKU7_CEPFO|nr:p450 domain-containing protein [Cephalotus follicularis]
MNSFITILLLIVPMIILLLTITKRRRSSSKRLPLPPGSLGLPIIGQSLSFFRAMKSNTAEKWLDQRTQKYGPISKLTLFGNPTVFISGLAANKFIFTSNSSGITSNQQSKSTRAILGDRNMLELVDHDHKRVRDALMLFLKPESLKDYVGKMDGGVREHLDMYWEGKQQVKVLPLMRRLTFDIICSLFCGFERGPKRDEFVDLFPKMVDGVWSVPINLPFTSYNRSLRATARMRKIVRNLIHEKRVQLENGASPHQDLITCLLSIRNDDNEELITEEEILQNVIFVMGAGYDTTSTLITFLVRLFANDPVVHASVLQEQEEIAKNNPSGESLTWEDLAKMKYTWRVAMETLRLFPPVFGGNRRALKDIEYDGHIIPKGWQIFWVAYKTHVDDRIFPEPTKFIPSRFENQASIPPYSFIPFGGGPRICPGMEYARIETLVAVHYLITRFSWKLCGDDSFSRTPLPVPSKGLPVQITSRKVW